MRRRIIPYNPKLKELARQLRKQGTLAEVLLWQQLRGKQRHGYDFHRQKPIGNFILDFYCCELLLGIEVDGSSHVDYKVTKDRERDKELQALGVYILRFTDEHVKKDLYSVVEAIDEWIVAHEPHRHEKVPSPEGI